MAVAMVFVRQVRMLMFDHGVSVPVRVLHGLQAGLVQMVVMRVVVTVPVLVFQRFVDVPVRVAFAEQQDCARDHHGQREEELQVRPLPEDGE